MSKLIKALHIIATQDKPEEVLREVVRQFVRFAEIEIRFVENFALNEVDEAINEAVTRYKIETHKLYKWLENLLTVKEFEFIEKALKALDDRRLDLFYYYLMCDVTRTVFGYTYRGDTVEKRVKSALSTMKFCLKFKMLKDRLERWF